jgi:hypothetical protein
MPTICASVFPSSHDTGPTLVCPTHAQRPPRNVNRAVEQARCRRCREVLGQPGHGVAHPPGRFGDTFRAVLVRTTPTPGLTRWSWYAGAFSIEVWAHFRLSSGFRCRFRAIDFGKTAGRHFLRPPVGSIENPELAKDGARVPSKRKLWPQGSIETSPVARRFHRNEDFGPRVPSKRGTGRTAKASFRWFAGLKSPSVFGVWDLGSRHRAWPPVDLGGFGALWAGLRRSDDRSVREQVCQGFNRDLFVEAAVGAVGGDGG